MHNQEAPIVPESTESVGRGLGLLVPVVLFALAYVLYTDPISFRSPTSPQPVPAWATDTNTVRQRRALPEYRKGNYTYECQECHQMWPAAVKIKVHAEVEMHHGINRRCQNCHHPMNRNAFVDDAGGEISWNDPQLVCAKCHGPVYRDWQHGAHGRSEGYWDTRRGSQQRRRCVECHDPHRPPFPPLRPAPGPETLRMGRQDFTSHEKIYDPLHPVSRSPGSAANH